MSENRFIDEPVKIETRDLGNGEKADFIIGRGIVFNKWSHTLMGKRDDGSTFTFVEKIEPRAIEGLDLQNVVCMVDHKITIGKRNKGTMDITITPDAVEYSVKVPNTTDGKNAIENVRNGNLEGSSFQFLTPEKGGDIWDKSVTPYQRTVTKFSRVTEMGPVTYPAYQDTTAAVRSLEQTETESEEETKKRELHEFEVKKARLVRKYNLAKINNIIK